MAAPAVMTTFQDITERRTGAQLIQSDKMATLGRLAAGMAHELSQPLNIIRLIKTSVDDMRERGKLK